MRKRNGWPPQPNVSDPAGPVLPNSGGARLLGNLPSAHDVVQHIRVQASVVDIVAGAADRHA